MNFHKILKEYIREFDPALIVLMETIVSRVQANRVVHSIGWPYFYRIKAMGFSGGIWALWKDNVEVKVEINNF